MWARGLKLAGTASRNRGPETSPAPAPAAPGGGETVERLKSKDQGTTPIKPHTYVSLQGDRFLTSSRKRGPRTVSGSSGVPPQQSIPGGPSSSMPSGNKDSGGRNRVPRWSSGPGLRSRSPLTGGRARKGGGAGRHPGPFSQTRGGSAEDTGRGGKGHTSGDGLDFFSPNPGAL